MVAHTVLLDFTVSSNVIVDVDKRSNLKLAIANVLQEHFDGLKPLTESSIDGSFLVLYTGPKGSLITVRGYTEGLITINIEYYKRDEEEALLDFELARELETALQAAAASTRSHSLTPIKRGGPFERYFPTADDRLLEYDIDKLVFEARSPYQKVQIVHSKSLGNLLVLDELQNISEADLIYTETLMQRGKESYTGKEIVILGGGDGGLLWELLKEKPKFVTMLEIDDVVIKACSQHMRSICGDCLDKRKDDNYEIIVGDCAKTLSHMIEEGRKFDYVFGDLTDIPISTTPHGDAWNFIRLILNSAMKVLKPTGKYMTHGNGASCPESLEMYEEVLSQLCLPVTFTKDSAFIPSFYEDWVFYQVSFDPSRRFFLNKSVPDKNDPDAGHKIPIDTTTLAFVHTKGGGYLYLFNCLVTNKPYKGAQLFFLLTVNNQTTLPNDSLQVNLKRTVQTYYCTNMLVFRHLIKQK